MSSSDTLELSSDYFSKIIASKHARDNRWFDKVAHGRSNYREKAMKLVTGMVNAVVAEEIIKVLETKAPFYCTTARHFDASLAAFPEHYPAVRIEVPVPENFAADIADIMVGILERHSGGGFVTVSDLHHHRRRS